MKRPRTGHVRPNLQGQAGIFQGVVPADVVDPLIGQDHVAPFGDTSLGPGNNMLYRALV